MGRDDLGKTVLKWNVDYRSTKRREADPAARTFDFLETLEVPHLTLADEKDSKIGCNPYDTGDLRPVKPRAS